jgi:hypothetical protein
MIFQLQQAEISPAKPPEDEEEMQESLHPNNKNNKQMDWADSDDELQDHLVPDLNSPDTLPLTLMHRHMGVSGGAGERPSERQKKMDKKAVSWAEELVVFISDAPGVVPTHRKSSSAKKKKRRPTLPFANPDQSLVSTSAFKSGSPPPAFFWRSTTLPLPPPPPVASPKSHQVTPLKVLPSPALSTNTTSSSSSSSSDRLSFEESSSSSVLSSSPTNSMLSSYNSVTAKLAKKFQFLRLSSSASGGYSSSL